MSEPGEGVRHPSPIPRRSMASMAEVERFAAAACWEEGEEEEGKRGGRPAEMKKRKRHGLVEYGALPGYLQPALCIPHPQPAYHPRHPLIHDSTRQCNSVGRPKKFAVGRGSCVKTYFWTEPSVIASKPSSPLRALMQTKKKAALCS
jgi:hypothetical protein